MGTCHWADPGGLLDVVLQSAVLVFGFRFVQVLELGLGWGSMIPSNHVSTFLQLCIRMAF